ncbi:MAG TPA: HAD family phosphatase [Pseudonocardiaceae bacterium]
MTKWLMLDYGGVVCHHQSEEVRAELVRLAGVDAAAFWAAFWGHRLPYDAGEVSAAGYWRTVAGTVGASWADEHCADLTRIDIGGWLRPNEDVLRVARESGLRLALLSNAPAELARAVRGLDWMAPFERLLFSCDLGTTKPDARCYRDALAQLGAEPHEVIFVDDRQENVDGARAVGIRAALLTDGARLDEVLSEVLGPASPGR